VTVGANAVSRYITFSVGKTALGGTRASGWGFTVAITGQDGFSSEQTRGFTPTAGDYSFGVCAVALSTPLCSADPKTVPKVMDTIVPTGVMQATELAPQPELCGWQRWWCRRGACGWAGS